ncbi:MAG: hypothetical protein ACKPH7_34735 [Planktothrix sp.]|uniref:hypothetical protein n=2 Tax=Planktothrix sp. TaxID=3088171 RepID=UPI0038D4A789
MSRKRSYKPSPGQLSLNLWGETTISSSQFPEPQPQQSSTVVRETAKPSVKETATKYRTSVSVLKTPEQIGETEPNRSIIQSPPLSPNQRVVPEILVPVGITFDPCQGIREVREAWKKNPVSSEVVFDCRHLELAESYSCTPNLDEFFPAEEQYLLGRGGYLNNAVLLNLLRCYGTLDKWRREVYQETGVRPISNFSFRRPDLNTAVGKLWDVLGMPGLTEKQPKNLWTADLIEFQSRIVTPFLMVDKKNRNFLNTNVQDWLDYISDRISSQTYNKLFIVVCEVMKNLVEHGNGGLFGLSIWPSGQIEIIWSNPIDHLKRWWPPDDNVKGLANSLLNSKGGGMPYIFKELLPQYKGVLIINWKTHNLIFRSTGESDNKKKLTNRLTSFDDLGFKPRSEIYLPRSILFQLNLFCPETRDRS